MQTKRKRDPLLSIHCMVFDPALVGHDHALEDEDGHIMTACMTHEPLGGYEVEVLIMPNVAPADVVKILRKAADWVERDLMEPASIKELRSLLEDHEDHERLERERSNREAVLDI